MAPFSSELLDDLNLKKSIAWLWDFERRHMVWATEAAVVFWKEPSLIDLLGRDFGPRHSLVGELENLRSELRRDAWSSERIMLNPDGQAVAANCRIRSQPITDDRLGALIEIEALNDPPVVIRNLTEAILSRYAPLPLAMYHVDGRLILKNVMAESLFTDRPNLDLMSRLGNADIAGTMILRTLADGAYSRTLRLSTAYGNRLHRVAAQPGQDPKTGAPTIIVSFQDVQDTYDLWREVAQAFQGLTRISKNLLSEAVDKNSNMDERETVPKDESLDSMRIAKLEAERKVHQQAEFVAKLSHEMRTPLNAIIGFGEVISEERLGPIGNEKYKVYVKDIVKSGHLLLSLINDLLDLSKIEAGKLKLDYSEVDLRDVINNSVRLLQPAAEKAQVTIRTLMPVPLPNVVADARSIHQILNNLLSNAIKFSHRGDTVTISGELASDGSITLHVRDQGIGMTKQDLKQALEPYGQVKGARRTDLIGSHLGGTGLGLPLAKALVEANKADFHIESAPEKGTRITVTFPSALVLVG